MYNDVQKRATMIYAKNNYKRVPLDLNIEFYERVKKYCEKNGCSVNGLIKELLKNEIDAKEESEKE